MHRIKSWLNALIVGGFALGGAQLPKITQDYQHQYKVRFSELRDQVAKTEVRAKVLQEEPMEYIQRHFLQNPDLEVAYQGRILEGNLKRFERMRIQLQESDQYREWLRPFFWLWSKDSKIAQDTWSTYQFGFVYSSATAIWAVIGACLGGILVALAGGIAQKCILSLRACGAAFWRKMTTRKKETSFEPSNMPVHSKDPFVDRDDPSHLED